MKISVAISVAVVALTCVASAVGAGAGGQVIDNGKVVADPQLDYRKYSKEIAASEKAAQANQAGAMSAAQQSVGADEASFQASLASVARSLNAGAPMGVDPAQDQDASETALPATPEPEPQHGPSMGAIVALAALALVGLVLIAVVLSGLGRKKSRRQPKEDSVRLVDFARKRDPDGKEE